MEQRLEFLLVQNIGALEAARWTLERTIARLKDPGGGTQVKHDPRTAIYQALRKSALLNLLISAVLLLMAIGVNVLGSKIPERGFFRFLIEQFFPILLCAAAVVFLAFGAYRYYVSQQRRRNAQAQRRQQRRQQLQRQRREQQRQEQLAFYEGELRQVEQLLDLCYQDCEIPGMYRSAQCLKHICDYMRINQTPLEQAVMHEQFTGGVEEDEDQAALEAGYAQLLSNRLQLVGNEGVERFVYQNAPNGGVSDRYRQSGSYFSKAQYLAQQPQ